jgi:hypothetical protein
MEKNMKNKPILIIIILLLGLIIINSCKDIADPDSKSIKNQSSKREFKKIDSANSFVPSSGKTIWSFLYNSINLYSWSEQYSDCGFRWVSAWSGNTGTGMPPANPTFGSSEYQTAYNAFNNVIMRCSGKEGPNDHPWDIFDDQNMAWMEKNIDYYKSYSGVIGWFSDEAFDQLQWIYFDETKHSPPTLQDRAMIDTVFYRLVRLANKAYPKKLFVGTAHKPSYGVAYYTNDVQNGTYRYWNQRLLDTCPNVEIWCEAYGKQWNNNGYWDSGADVTQDFYNSYNSYTGRMGFWINIDEVPGHTQDPENNTDYNWNHVLNFMNQQGISKVGIWGDIVTGATVNKFCEAAKYYNFLEYSP